MTTPKKITLEICAYTLESALAAQAGGADRVELCSDPSVGGTTPSFGTIVMARENLTIDLHVMIRPRGGDFLYSELEFAAMKKDIQFCKNTGVNGVVFGILQPNPQVDKERCSELVEASRPMSVTFHRAFDMTADPLQALEDVIACGCTRVLTSGQAQTAVEGASLIAQLVKRAGKRIIVMAGAGIGPQNLAQLVMATGARELHASVRTPMISKMLARGPKPKLSLAPDEYDVVLAHETQIKKMREIADSLAFTK